MSSFIADVWVLSVDPTTPKKLEKASESKNLSSKAAMVSV
ncbi:unnamed protein product [marine sediment metagenome]|uniref:Uncharacterized protein n=1 Tax=marine sediment metagenome TaxID=412755 RepID=X1MN67_9ZZZZ